jgi:hypothetical protein
MPDCGEAFGIINQGLEVDKAVHRGWPLHARDGSSQEQPDCFPNLAGHLNSQSGIVRSPADHHHPETRYEPGVLSL